MKTHLFGGYIKYPGTIHVMNTLAIGRRGTASISLRDMEISGRCTLLTKRYFSPVEAFACRIVWWPHFYLALCLSLVPERALWRWVAAILTAITLLLGKAHLDLWGDHSHTGGQDDFYVHKEIPYALGKWRFGKFVEDIQ